MKVTHKPDCTRVFKRYDLTCPRCQELAQGKPAREGWGSFHARQDMIRIESIRTHNCQLAHCGPVCTFGDW
jgi:hypothetical protein